MIRKNDPDEKSKFDIEICEYQEREGHFLCREITFIGKDQKR